MVLERESEATGFGFSLAGGDGAPAVVRSIVPESLAYRDGRLRCGDLLLELNGVNVERAPHAQVVAALKAAGTRVTLTIVSWPGTVV